MVRCRPETAGVDAAQVNAVTSDAAASDDSDLRNIVHCGTPLTATALAIAEHNGVERRRRAGRDRARLRTRRAYHRRGAGCAGARVSRLDARDLRGDRGGRAAVAARCGSNDARDRSAATSAGGLAKAADTSVAREYNCGNATLLGIQAAEAARRGYTCEERVLEMKQAISRRSAARTARRLRVSRQAVSARPGTS